VNIKVLVYEASYTSIKFEAKCDHSWKVNECQSLQPYWLNFGLLS